MRIIAFIEDPKAIDKIIGHLKLSFQAERPPPPQVVQHELLMAAEESGNPFPGTASWASLQPDVATSTCRHFSADCI